MIKFFQASNKTFRAHNSKNVVAKTIKWRKRSTLGKSAFSLYIILTVVLSFSAITAEAQEHTFPFGREGEIVYNTQTGTVTVMVQDTRIISDAYAEALNGTISLNSKEYSDRSISQVEINDGFGAGVKIVVTLTATGLPEMQQVFYTYANRDYFLTEVLIKGEGVSSNYMAPLVSNDVEIGAIGDNRVLFTPFDNDTFIRYNSRSMESLTTSISSEVTAFYENESRKGLVVGSVEHMVWKTGIETSGSGDALSALTVWGGYTDINVTRDAISHGIISGDSVKSPKIFVGLFDDWRIGLEEYGKANAIAEPRYIFDWTAPTPFGWNSWGAIQTDLNLENAKAVANFFSTSLPEFRNGETAYIDLDSYWDNMISGGLEGDFSDLIAFVKHCKDRGLKPGIYWAPFVDWGKFDRPVEGSNYTYSEVWTNVDGAYHDLDGARAMDPTHPATQERINLVIDKFKTCGFEMIKIDFIGHAAIEADSFYDPTVKTGMQAFRKGMEYLTDRLDDKMLVYAAISPSLATGRYTHARRIACDAYADMNATEYTLNSTTYGWWQTYLYNFIDADHLVFDNESLGENRARLTSGVVNGTLITGDDFSTEGQWTERAKDLLQNQDILDIARNGVAFRPVEGNSESGASEVFVNKIKDEHYVAVVNYGAEKSYALNMERLGMDVGIYGIKELFSGNQSSIDGSVFEVVLGAQDAAIFRFKEGQINAVEPADSADTIALFPNPTNNILKIRNKNGIRSIKLSALNGKVFKEVENVNRNNYSMDISDYKSGVYLITLIESDGGIKYYKVIKE